MRLKLLAAMARLLGIQFKVDGMPYGATTTDSRCSTNPHSHSCTQPNPAEA
jgi:hypothetical protein